MSDVNMLTSLKALLFSSAATQIPADGAGAIAMPGDGAVDFAQLLNGSMATSPIAQAAAGAGEAVAAMPTVALPHAADLAGKEALAADAVTANSLPFGLATALNAVQSHRKASLPLPAGLTQQGQKAQVAEAATAAETGASTPDGDNITVDTEAAGPVTEEPAVIGADPAEALVTADPVALDRPAVKPRVPVKAAGQDVVKAEAVPDASVAEQPGEEATVGEEQKKPAVEQADATPLPLPLSVPMTSVLPQPAAAAETRNSLEGRSLAALPQVASTGPDAQPGVAAAPSEKPEPEKLVPVQAADIPVAVAEVDPQKVKQARPAKPATENVAAVTTDEKPVIAEQAPVAIPAAQAQPVKSEALALLQMVRDQVAGRQSGASTHGAEQPAVSGRGKVGKSTAAAEAAAASSAQPLSADAAAQAMPSQPAVGTSAPQTVAAAPPVADLSASLGAQVVDMGVSGQWIDGLARDIAGLSANGAQGRFQINADKLGPVQVDIRQGQDGAAVSLTVASEAAETALRQDSDRLRLDAGLAAVRITDVKIERAPHVAEAARADSASQQGSQQQSSQQQSGQNPWSNNQTMGQNMNQSQGQNRWQARENGGFTPKNSGDPAVLNHDDTRRAANDAARARYA